MIWAPVLFHNLHVVEPVGGFEVPRFCRNIQEPFVQRHPIRLILVRGTGVCPIATHAAALPCRPLRTATAGGSAGGGAKAVARAKVTSGRFGYCGDWQKLILPRRRGLRIAHANYVLEERARAPRAIVFLDVRSRVAIHASNSAWIRAAASGTTSARSSKEVMHR